MNIITEIIIDGVDVSGCKNFSCGICEEENKISRTINHFTADCTFYPNCYYKQLKRSQNALQDIKTLVTTDYIQIKRQLVQNYDCLDNFMQKIEDKCGDVLK